MTDIFNKTTTLVGEYHISDMSLGGAVEYFGFVEASGRWFIMEHDTATHSFRYKAGATDYATAWANKLMLVYGLYNDEF